MSQSTPLTTGVPTSKTVEATPPHLNHDPDGELAQLRNPVDRGVAGVGPLLVWRQASDHHPRPPGEADRQRPDGRPVEVGLADGLVFEDALQGDVLRDAAVNQQDLQPLLDHLAGGHDSAEDGGVGGLEAASEFGLKCKFLMIFFVMQFCKMHWRDSNQKQTV